MTYQVIADARFRKEFKRLSKKYPSLKADFAELVSQLEENPFIGADLGGNVRKIRMAISSKNKGKSGGARVLTYTLLIDVSLTDVHVFYIYDKSERATVSDKEISDLTKEIGLESNQNTTDKPQSSDSTTDTTPA